MLSFEEQERIVRVGPGTEMGDLMRRYWHPIATSAQLPIPDSPPLLQRLLGQSLVVFRDTEGKVGVLDEKCMHRRVSLAIGRVEEGGIRCLYHGWKFGVDGQILETPNNPDPKLRQRLTAPAYPVVEKSGLIWTYLGPKPVPPFRVFEADEVDDDHRLVMRVDVKANYLQLWEGGLDSSHVSTLHTNQTRPSWAASRTADQVVDAYKELEDVAPVLASESTYFGFHYAATRTVKPRDDAEMRNVRIVPAIMPTGRIIPGPGIKFLVWETPMDDESTATYISAYTQGEAPLDKAWVYRIMGLDDPRIWTPGDPTFKPSFENGFLQDRSSMHMNWTGLRGIEPEDGVMSVSAGPIADRTRENLVAADLAVVQARRMLRECLDKLRKGDPVPGADVADMRHVTAPDVDVPAGVDWRTIAPQHRSPSTHTKIQ